MVVDVFVLLALDVERVRERKCWGSWRRLFIVTIIGKTGILGARGWGEGNVFKRANPGSAGSVLESSRYKAGPGQRGRDRRRGKKKIGPQCGQCAPVPSSSAQPQVPLRSHYRQR